MSVYQGKKFQLVELFVPAGNDTQTQFDFQDIPKLRGKIIDFIRVYCHDDIPTTKTGKTVISAAIMQRCYLMGYCTDMDRVAKGTEPAEGAFMGENINLVPFIDLHDMQSGTANVPFTREKIYFGSRWDFAKTSIYTGGAIGTSQVSFLLGVWYRNK